MKYLVTAIVSTYNAEQFIRGCLEDLQGQTIADRLEIIVINSASPQGEERIVKEFQRKYSNIKYLRTGTRESLYKAWNRGIRMAGGKYITNANTDDRHSPDALEVLSLALEENPGVGFAYADCLVTTRENERFEENSADRCLIFPPFSKRQLLVRQFFGSHPMWRRSLHESVGYFSEQYQVTGDYDFYIRAGLKCDGLHVPRFLSLYCERPGSIEHANIERMNEEQSAIQDMFRDSVSLETLYPNLDDYKGDTAARSAALLDQANGFVESTQDYPRAGKRYRWVETHTGPIPEVLNNRAVCSWLQGKKQEALELLDNITIESQVVRLNRKILHSAYGDSDINRKSLRLLVPRHPVVSHGVPVFTWFPCFPLSIGDAVQRQILDGRPAARGEDYVLRAVQTLDKNRLASSELLFIADYLRRTGHLESSLNWFRAVIKTSEDAPHLSRAGLSAGEILEILGDKRAPDLYREAVARLCHGKEKTTLEMYNIASLHKRAGHWEEARKWFNRVLEKSPGRQQAAGAGFHLGELALWSTNPKEAERQFARCLELNPRHEKARQYLKESPF